MCTATEVIWLRALGSDSEVKNYLTCFKYGGICNSEKQASLRANSCYASGVMFLYACQVTPLEVFPDDALFKIFGAMTSCLKAMT